GEFSALVSRGLVRQPREPRQPRCRKRKMPARQKVVIPDDINGAFRASPDLDRLKEVASIEIFGSRPAGETELIARVRDAGVILSFRPAFTRFPRPVIEAA